MAGIHDQADSAGIRRRIQAELPVQAFERAPGRAVMGLALLTLITVFSCLLLVVPLPLLACMAMSAACGFLYASLFFIGHEAGHGSIVGSRRGQDLLMWPAFAIFLLSPTLWRVWHNQVHHCHANHDGHDPDNFGELASYRESLSVRLAAALTPGAGRLGLALVVPLWFTLHAQGVLWMQSKTCSGFESLARHRAVAESLLMAASWAALGWCFGAAATLWVIIIPMAVANTIVMSYIATNHLLRPLVDRPDPLESSMSVTTHWSLDLIHCNFSHHVEHHLFPSMSPKYAPLVRRRLRVHAGDRFLAPPHWLALRMVFATPRIHDGNEILVDPRCGTHLRFDRISEVLRCNPQHMPKPRSTPS